MEWRRPTCKPAAAGPESWPVSAPRRAIPDQMLLRLALPTPPTCAGLELQLNRLQAFAPLALIFDFNKHCSFLAGLTLPLPSFPPRCSFPGSPFPLLLSVSSWRSMILEGKFGTVILWFYWVPPYAVQCKCNIEEPYDGWLNRHILVDSSVIWWWNLDRYGKFGRSNDTKYSINRLVRYRIRREIG